MIKYLSVGAVFLLVLGSIFGFHYYQATKYAEKKALFKPPPTAVNATVAKTESWPKVIPTVGHFQAVQSVDLSVQISGIVTDINFSSNQQVKKGQKLLTLDTKVLTSTLKGQLATLKQVRRLYFRNLELFKKNAISKETIDESESTYLSQKAEVEKIQALIEQKILHSPFSGKLGIRKVNIGQFFSPGDTVVKLETTDPIYLNFVITEKDLAKIKVGQSVKANVDAYKGETFIGEITAIGTSVTAKNLGLEVQATFKNSTGKLKSGLFAKVGVFLQQKFEVISLPQSALTYSLYGDSVYVLTRPQGAQAAAPFIAKQVNVKVGVRQSGKVAILSGVKPGDLIVTLGQLKLHPGASVSVKTRKEVKP